MITKKTVFILGAGASAPYGFPSGEGLLREVARQLTQMEGTTAQVLAELGHSRWQREDFQQAIIHAQPPSIDLFLERRQDFMRIGKDMIAAGLIPHEHPDRLFSFDRPEPVTPASASWPWYRYLFHRLGDNPDEFRQNFLSIITFNYDRSLEFYLFTAIKHRWQLKDEEITELLTNEVPILHVYGQLGKLPELGAEGRPYEPKVSVDSVTKAAAEIHILHEAEENSPALQRARKELGEAALVCFLGFGYHKINLERLQVKKLFGTQRTVLGSAFNLLQGERSPISARFSPANISLGNPDEDLLLFLRKRSILG